MSRLVCSLLVWCCAAGAAAQEYGLAPLWKAGGVGSGPGEFGTPESVAIDSLGRVVVTDKGRMMLHVYAREDGRALFDVGTLGSGLGDFDRPNGIAVDAAGRVLVVEQTNQRVQILDRDYRPLGAFWRGASGNAAFTKPMGIALDPRGQIYVTDEARADVQVFDGSGRYLWRFATTPRLDRVESIEIDTLRQRVFVCDEGRAQVNLYDMQGRFTGAFGSQGSGPGEFGNVPNAVRLDTQGRIYINDQGNARINVYRPDTRFLASFRCNGRAMESADGMALSEPHDLLLVADQGNNRVLAFALSELQCRLARDEIEPPAAAIAALAASADSLALGPGALPAYVGARVDLEAVGAGGDPARVESTIVHVRTQSDRRGLLVTLVETGPATDRYRAHFELAERTAGGRLAATEPDTLRLHVGGGEDLPAIPIVRLPPPEAAGLRVEQARTGRLGSDSPTLGWNWLDPAGRRRQTAAQLRIRRANGDPWWLGPVVAGPGTRCRYTGPPLPRGEWLRAEVRVATAGGWGEWAATPLWRTTPPTVLEPVGLGICTVLREWPVPLRGRIAPGTDTDLLRASVEIERARQTVYHRPARFPFTGVVEAIGPLPALAEDEVVRWRIVLRDNVGRIEGPWWILVLNADPGPTRPRTRDTLAPAGGATDSLAGGGAPGAAFQEGKAEAPPPLTAGAGLQLRVGPPGAAVDVEVFDVRGRRVGRGRTDHAGMWTWEGRDARGARLPRGLYLVRSSAYPLEPPRKLLWTGR